MEFTFRSSFSHFLCSLPPNLSHTHTQRQKCRPNLTAQETEIFRSLRVPDQPDLVICRLAKGYEVGLSPKKENDDREMRMHG